MMTDLGSLSLTLIGLSMILSKSIKLLELGDLALKFIYRQ
jgi:hypothetical protein